jgi:nicotinamidase-related amidase
MTANLSRTILLPIDVQRGFDDPSWPPRWNAEMEANGRALLAHWRHAGAPIVHVRHDSVIRTGANMGWTMLLVPDACDCFDLPDGEGGTIPARTIQAAHVATLAAEFCEIATTAALTGA